MKTLQRLITILLLLISLEGFSQYAAMPGASGYAGHPSCYGHPGSGASEGALVVKGATPVRFVG